MHVSPHALPVVQILQQTGDGFGLGDGVGLGFGAGVGAVMVMCAPPCTPEYVAMMSTSPAASAVTIPEAETAARVPLEDCQLAWLVTVCVVLLDITAVAVNCAESPGFAMEDGPVTVTDVTVGVGLGVVGVCVLLVPPLPPQLPKITITATKHTDATNGRRTIIDFELRMRRGRR